MLHKSFKPAKCKTSLKLATSRIKLMKNKKGVQINLLKRDLAHLLETGQDRTARIRVEHVIREEKMVAAYDLIEIYCELIVARLPIIESQKICPVDLKEAVTSVIFAAPRCSDISELSDIRKQFTAKYGKEFVSTAIELRPDCGVSRMLVEKLSAVAPDLQTKIKVLSAVAKEHNIEWDPTSFEEESKPPNDLLNGPANIEKAGMINVDPANIQTSNSNGGHTREEKQDAPFDFAQQNKKYTLGTQNIVATDTDARSSGLTSEMMKMRQRFPRGGEDDISSGRQHWDMDFKDVTSAAQAAAESAERAAMAARAAAQFSSQERTVKRHPAGSHIYKFKDEISRVSAPSGSVGEGPSKDSGKNMSADMEPRILYQQMGQHEHDASLKASHVSDERSSIPTFVRSNNDPIKDEKSVNNVPMADQHFEESLHEDQETPSSPEMTTLEGFKEYKPEVESGQKGSFESEDVNYFAEEAIKNQPKFCTSHSHSSTSSYEYNVPDHQKLVKKSIVGNPFAFVDQGNLFRESATSSNVDASRDDEYISDDDNGPRFDTGFEYDDVEAKSFFMSPSRESPTRSLENARVWSPRTNKSNTVDQVSSQSHLFSESLSFQEHSVKSVGPSETDDHIPASFDHSDGPDSESDSEIAKSIFSGKKEFPSSNVHDILSTIPEPSFVEPPQNVKSRKSRIELDDLVESELSLYDSMDEEKRPQSQSSSSLLLGGHELEKQTLDQVTNDALEDNNFLNQSNDLDVRKELNFGTLTGGLRNKGGLRFPPYTKSAANDASNVSRDKAEESPITVDQTSLQNSLDSRVSKTEDKKPSVSKPSSDSDSDDYSDNFIMKSSEKISKQANPSSLFAPPAAFFDDDGSDSEEVINQAPSRVRLASGLSRRTRGSTSVPYSKSHADPEVKTVISNSKEDRKPSTHSHPVEPRSYIREFKEYAKQIPESQPPLNLLRNTAEIGSTEAQGRLSKRSTYNNETLPEHQGKTKPILGSKRSSGENLVNKPSHVHPNLPDYDSLAARLQSLQRDNQ